MTPHSPQGSHSSDLSRQTQASSSIFWPFSQSRSPQTDSSLPHLLFFLDMVSSSESFLPPLRASL